MTLKAVLFGSIGTLVETSEHQRQAFNRAFENARLDWHWNQATYEQLLSINGGRRRLRHYADEINTPMDDAQITAIHADKSRIYQQMLRTDGLSLRPGVRDLMNSARREGILVGLVSATSLANISAIDAALGDNSPLCRLRHHHPQWHGRAP
jgi:beta-phosphoglucomutase-like phosphatase (HAD superfamily)